MHLIRALRPAVALVVALCSTFLSVAAPGAAADGSAVSVTVVEDVSKAPIPRAGVRLVSTEREYDGLTDARGVVRFTGVVPGTYGVFAAEPDYAFARTYAITVAPGALESVSIVGMRARPRRIGGVQSRAETKPNAARSRNNDDAAATLSGSVGAGLASVPSVTAPAFGALTIHNEGPSSTTATVNGAPIFASGSKIPLGLLQGDVFSSAGLAAAIGAPGGALNLQTYDPVIDWSGLAQVRAGSFGSTASGIQERGTAGRFGLAFVHSDVADSTALDGRLFADTSGLAYVHDATQRSGGDAFTLRYGFDPTHVAYVDVGRLALSTPLTCTIQSGPLPCGFGPGNAERRTVSYVQLRDRAAIGKSSVDVNVFTSTDQMQSDLANQLVEGVAVGSFSDVRTRKTGATVKLAYALTPRRAATLAYSVVGESSRVLGVGTPGQPVPTGGNTRSELTLAVPLLATRRLTAHADVGSNTAYGRRGGVYGADAVYDATARDAFSASFSAGLLPSRLYGFNGVGLPELLQVDCGSRRAAGYGPTSDEVPAPAQRTTVGYKRSARSYQVGIDAFRDVSRDVPVTGDVPAAALPSTFFNAGYLATAGAIASRECGAPLSFATRDLSFTTTAPVSLRVTDGFDAGAQIDVSPRANVQIAYSLARARAFGASALFVDGSTVVPGKQLPQQPLSRLNLAGRFAASRATTALLNVNVVGANNPWSARGFASLDAGVRARYGFGDVIAGVQNVTNANGGAFGRFDPFPLRTTPYTPRTFSVRARLALGRQNIDRAAYLSAPLVANDGLLFFTPVDYEPRPPQGWLAPATDTPFCGPEMLPKAKETESAIGAYEADVRAAIEAGRAATSVPPRAVAGMTLSPLQAAGGYAIRIAFERGRAKDLAPLLRCGVLHQGNYDQAKALGLYIPSWQQADSDSFWVLYYAPQAGLYFAPNPVNETSDDTPPPMTFAATAPRAPFAVKTCPPSLRPAVEDSANALRVYAEGFYAGMRPTVPVGFAITPHVASAETWLEIRPDNRAVGDALVRCLNVPQVAQAEIARRGLGGAFTPSISYAPGVGLYQKRP